MIEIAETRDIETCRALRKTVFVMEQNVPEEEELDGLDEGAVHLLAFADGRPVGTARLLVKGETGKIGRVCVLREARGTGLGAALIRAGEAKLHALGCARAQLGAQCHAIAFYEKLGFSAYGPIYDDAGIPHRDMEKRL